MPSQKRSLASRHSVARLRYQMSNSNSGNKQKSGLVQRQLNKGVQLAKEDGKSLASFGAEGLSSGAYVYPL